MSLSNIMSFASISFAALSLIPSIGLAVEKKTERKCIYDNKKRLCIGDKVTVKEPGGSRMISLTITSGRQIGEGSMLLIEGTDAAGKTQELDPNELGFSKDCQKWSGHLLFSDRVECIQRPEKVRQLNPNNCVKVARGKICEGDVVWDTTKRDSTIYSLELYVYQISTIDGVKLLRVSRNETRDATFVSPADVGLTKGCVENSEKEKFCVGNGVYFKRSVYPKQEAVVGAIYPDGTMRVLYWDNPGSASRTEKATLKIESADYLTKRDSNSLKFPYIY